MITFKEFFTNLLVETIIDRVPRNMLGMTSNVQSLPDKQPYGFWVDRSGNFVQVPLYGHEQVLFNILAKTEDYLDKHNVPYDDFKFKYSDLFDNGWARVVVSPDKVLYELGDGHELTNSQRKFLMLLQDLYDKGTIHRDVSYKFGR